MSIISPSKRIIDMTAEEFSQVLIDAFRQAGLPEPVTERDFSKTQPKRYVYGIAGIAGLFNCSMTTANRIKASGKIDQAISQSGRMIAVDADLALQLMKKTTV